jgi:hypothetical protein
MIVLFNPKNYGKFGCIKKIGLKTFEHFGNNVGGSVAINDNLCGNSFFIKFTL